ncbi:signal transduction histidine kinase [Streptomyces sp. SLBN-118]|uniref:sensor histidine kinase n=1 Tax=Streptomyces sp. SLBN-118 TaxID=2768454 RepID=UPI001152F2A4|nr:ATP-binding protein [Streptomyces sp. SLBN-118]TQK50683.1 signal transduction histidine kinase [Streptomyces sp. SLBN-118]
MSQLRAPAARPDRREGGRHGRPGARSLSSAGRSQPVPPSPDARIRPQLLRTAVLPAIVAALSGATAVFFTIRTAGLRPGVGLWSLLGGAAVLALAAVAAAFIGADRTSKSVLDRCAALRHSSARGQADLQMVVEQLRRGEGPPPRRAPTPAPLDADEFDLLTQELSRSHDAAVAAVVQASRLSSSVGNEQKVEVFVNLARRLQSLVHREIQLLDELENEVEDPELLKGLFHVDHLATRIRRHAENLAVLGGAISRRQWSNPVTMTEVLRSAIAEVEQYPRVKLVPPIDGTLRGHAVADVIHLLAELVENATLFSAPHTQVLMRAQHVTAGLAVEVEDRGLGMPVGEQNKMNALLADPDQVNVAHLLQDGRIGLFVVSALARRHGIAVRLQSNIYGGVQAVLVLPQGLLGAESDALQQHGAAAASEAAAHPRGETAVTRATSVRTPVHQQPHSPPQLPQQQGPPQREPVHATLGSSSLPVRGEHADRPNPAEASPRAGHPGDFYADANYTTPAPSSPPEAAPVVRGTTGRPQLPKRRSQEHLVPQLRDAPAPRRDEEHAVHDPGLMAAFQRGIGLAESQPLADSAPLPDPQRHDNTPKE